MAFVYEFVDRTYQALQVRDGHILPVCFVNAAAVSQWVLYWALGPLSSAALSVAAEALGYP